MFVCGVDPGLRGYQCCLPRDRSGEPVFSLPPHEGGRISRVACVRLVRDWLAAGVRLVVLEEQQPMRKKGVRQGSVSVWSLATTFATWATALEAAGFREAEGFDDAREREEERHLGVGGLKEVCTRPVYLIVAPQSWKARMGCMGAGGDRKRALELIVEAARAAFPGVDLRAVERAKDLSRHGASADKAAALLLAEMGRRLLERGAGASNTR